MICEMKFTKRISRRHPAPLDLDGIYVYFGGELEKQGLAREKIEELLIGWLVEQRQTGKIIQGDHLLVRFMWSSKQDLNIQRNATQMLSQLEDYPVYETHSATTVIGATVGGLIYSTPGVEALACIVLLFRNKRRILDPSSVENGIPSVSIDFDSLAAASESWHIQLIYDDRDISSQSISDALAESMLPLRHTPISVNGDPEVTDTILQIGLPLALLWNPFAKKILERAADDFYTKVLTNVGHLIGRLFDYARTLRRAEVSIATKYGACTIMLIFPRSPAIKSKMIDSLRPAVSIAVGAIDALHNIGKVPREAVYVYDVLRGAWRLRHIRNHDNTLVAENVAFSLSKIRDGATSPGVMKEL